MVFFIEICKGIFFFLSIIIWLFFLRWDVIIGQQYYIIIKEILMPWYLIFCGIMLGYILARIQVWYDDEQGDYTKVLTKSFLIWTSIWVVLAIIYILI